MKRNLTNHDDDDEAPISDGMKTIAQALRIPRKVYQVVFAPIMQLFYIIALMALGFLILGEAQYYFVCLPRNEDVTFYQCISHNEPKPTKGHRQ